MTSAPNVLAELSEDFFDDAPCGYVFTRPDDTIVEVNRTFQAWTGLDRDQLLDGRRFPDLLSPGGRMYWETHCSPLLHMQGTVREIAVEIVRADGTHLPALIDSTLRRDAAGTPRIVRTSVFDATDRRRYEAELLAARRREREIAQQLQRSLLSGDLPRADGLELAAAYRPGVSGLEVGGDWYDAFWLDDGVTVGLAVGDVVGRGIPAAATMGQLRSALRALATQDLTPCRLLERLDEYARRHDLGLATTLVYAQLRLDTRELRFACAGHPPPLIVAPGESPQLDWEGRSAPLDTYLDARPATETTRCLEPGSVVLLYTDGLVERRTRPLDDGLQRLCEEAESLRDDPLGAMVDALISALHDPEHPDDTCVLAARVGG